MNLKKKSGIFLNKVLNQFGYHLNKMHKTQRQDKGLYTIHSYLNEEGKFDYQKYKKIQQEGNKSKLDLVWVKEENIRFICKYIKKNLNVIDFGICHGTRNGREQAFFKKYLDCKVIGTEISETADQFPDTIQWDFHEVKEEWLNATDFIYSNSLDHSYDPEKCLNNWVSCLKPGNFCIIEHSNLHEPDESGELDPFGAEITFMPYLITKWGKGNFFVREILEAPKLTENATYSSIIIVQKAMDI